MGTQFLLAKPGATFVKLWLESYKDYRASLWYYNAGEYPTKVKNVNIVWPNLN